MRLSRLLMIMALGGMALVMLLLAPAATVATAQTGTQTPPVIIITATPFGAPAGGDTGGTTTSPVVTTPNGSATPVPEGWAAFVLARTALQKKIGGNLTYVTNWNYEIMLFQDSALGCPKQGETPIPGPAAGYQILIRPLGNPNTYEYRVTYDLQRVYDCGIAGTAQPGTITSPGNLAAVSGSANMNGFELGGQVQELNAGTIATMQSAKMKWVKQQYRVPNSGGAAAFVSQAHAAGFKVLISYVGAPSDIASGAGFFDQYAQQVGQIAAAGADAIEIWNEMNLDREWPTGQISAANYTQLLAKASAAIRGANGSTIIVSGALSPTGAAGPAGKTANYWNDDVYMQELAAAGAGQYFDCVGVHYNEGVVSPNQASGDPRDSYPTRYFSTMLQRAVGPFPDKKACFTELGYLSPDGYGALPAQFAWGQNTDVNEQATWLAQAAVASANSGRVRMMIIFNVDFTYFGADPQAGYAIKRPGGGCPACGQLASVMQ